MTSAPAFVPTFLYWYNSAPDDYGRCAKIASADIGTYESLPRGASHPGQVHAKGKPPHPVYGQWQVGLALSKTSQVLVIDVDDAAEYKLSDLAIDLPLERATSVRVTEDGKAKFHFVVVVPPTLVRFWPKQGATAWGDIKSNGFSYITGIHSTGSAYVAMNQPLVYANEELMDAINAEPRAQAQGSSSGGAAGEWTSKDYLYADGTKWVRGVADVASMVNQGMLDWEIQILMTEILQRSGGYYGQGEEVAGWINSARAKYNILEGETRQESELRFIFGDAGYENIMVRAAKQQADYLTSQAPLAYLQDRQGFIASQFDDADTGVPPQVPDLSQVNLSSLMNPSGIPVEPYGASDSDLADLFLDSAFGTPECPGVLAFTGDAGCWVRDYGHVWREWGTKSEARDYTKSAVAAWARNLKTVAQLENEERQATGDEGPLGEIEMVAGKEEDTEYGARKKRLIKVRTRLHSDAGCSAVANLSLAKARPGTTVFVSDMDGEPHVIWAGGTPWSLLSHELTIAPESIGHKHLKTCAVAPVPGPHPLWDEALTALFPDAGVREWAVRELAGACLWGDTSKEHPVLDGKPNAGKSTVTDTIRKILGNYAVDVDPNKLIGGNEGSANEEERAAMIGARMVLLDEPPKRDRQSISQFNRIASGTGEIAASAKFKNRVSGPKRFNMVINQNQRNRMKLDAEGVRQRLVFIPCGDGMPLELYKRFNAGIKAEYPAILATLIRECAMFHTGHRLPVPHVAQMALDCAYADGDEFPQWLWDNFELPKSKPTGHDENEMPGFDFLRKAYAEHCRSVPGVAPLTRQQLRERLGEMGIHIKDWAGSTGKRRNVVLIKALPSSQASGWR
jgi:hypothetical protein